MRRRSTPTWRLSRQPQRAACTAMAIAPPASVSAGWRMRSKASASSRATGWRRWPRAAFATSSSTTPSPASAQCCTPSTRGCLLSRSPILPTTPGTGRCSPTPPSCRWRSSLLQHSRASAPTRCWPTVHTCHPRHPGQGGPAGQASPTRSSMPSFATRRCWRSRLSISIGPSSTRTRRARSATPRGPLVSRRGFCSPTARLCWARCASSPRVPTCSR